MKTIKSSGVLSSLSFMLLLLFSSVSLINELIVYVSWLFKYLDKKFCPKNFKNFNKVFDNLPKWLFKYLLSQIFFSFKWTIFFIILNIHLIKFTIAFISGLSSDKSISENESKSLSLNLLVSLCSSIYL